jgi:hypothetical protein
MAERYIDLGLGGTDGLDGRVGERGDGHDELNLHKFRAID